MKIYPVYLHKSNQMISRNQICFKGESKDQKIIVENGKQYVKVPKWSHDLENWVFGILTGIAVLEIIHLLITKKPEPWEGILKG